MDQVAVSSLHQTRAGGRIETMTLRKEFFEQKARVYVAWTGLAWTWQVSAPDARWACGHEWFSLPTFTEAITVLCREIRKRSYAVHPWRSPELADANWTVDA